MRSGPSVCHMKAKSIPEASEWKMPMELSDQHARLRTARLDEPMVRRRLRMANICSSYKNTDASVHVFIHLSAASSVHSFTSNESKIHRCMNVFLFTFSRI